MRRTVKAVTLHGNHGSTGHNVGRVSTAIKAVNASHTTADTTATLRTQLSMRCTLRIGVRVLWETAVNTLIGKPHSNPRPPWTIITVWRVPPIKKSVAFSIIFLATFLTSYAVSQLLVRFLLWGVEGWQNSPVVYLAVIPAFVVGMCVAPKFANKVEGGTMTLLLAIVAAFLGSVSMQP
jgi:hypothetical protein